MFTGAPGCFGGQSQPGVCRAGCCDPARWQSRPARGGDISQLAKGEIVIGATPMPADTSDTARLRCVSNQPVTVAIVGTKTAPAEPPTMTPVDKLELEKAGGSTCQREAYAKQDSTRQHDDHWAEAVGQRPQPKAPKPMVTKTMVMALEMPVRDQPVAADIGCRKTASENTVPMPRSPSARRRRPRPNRNAASLLDPRKVAGVVFNPTVKLAQAV